MNEIETYPDQTAYRSVEYDPKIDLKNNVGNFLSQNYKLFALVESLWSDVNAITEQARLIIEGSSFTKRPRNKTKELKSFNIYDIRAFCNQLAHLRLQNVAPSILDEFDTSGEAGMLAKLNEVCRISRLKEEKIFKDNNTSPIDSSILPIRELEDAYTMAVIAKSVACSRTFELLKSGIGIKFLVDLSEDIHGNSIPGLLEVLAVTFEQNADYMSEHLESEIEHGITKEMFANYLIDDHFFTQIAVKAISNSLGGDATQNKEFFTQSIATYMESNLELDDAFADFKGRQLKEKVLSEKENIYGYMHAERLKSAKTIPNPSYQSTIELLSANLSSIDIPAEKEPSPESLNPTKKFALLKTSVNTDHNFNVDFIGEGDMDEGGIDKIMNHKIITDFISHHRGSVGSVEEATKRIRDYLQQISDGSTQNPNIDFMEGGTQTFKSGKEIASFRLLRFRPHVDDDNPGSAFWSKFRIVFCRVEIDGQEYCLIKDIFYRVESSY